MNRASAVTLVIASAAAAIIAPVWTYALSLAIFGLPHVLVELRYVDERFSARLPRHTLLSLGLCLGGIVLMRTLALTGAGSSGFRMTTELLLGLLLVAVAVPLLIRLRASAIGITVFSALLLGILYAPILTLVVFAVLHNLTPVGFLAERLRGRERRRALMLAGIVFLGIPAVILAIPASGWAAIGPFSVGHLDNHLTAFVPPALLGTSIGDRLFATAAYLQCMHYAVVIHILPKLSAGSERVETVVPWPKHSTFMASVAIIGIVTAINFAFSFSDTRSVYAVFAAVHAWIEIPILIIACAVLPKSELKLRAAT
jgi:hypothetical protein